MYVREGLLLVCIGHDAARVAGSGRAWREQCGTT